MDPAVAGQDVRLSEEIPALGNQEYEVDSQTLELERKCANLARAGALADPAQQTQTRCSLDGPPAAADFLLRVRASGRRLRQKLRTSSPPSPACSRTDTHEVWAARRRLSHGRRPLRELPWSSCRRRHKRFAILLRCTWAPISGSGRSCWTASRRNRSRACASSCLTRPTTSSFISRSR